MAEPLFEHEGLPFYEGQIIKVIDKEGRRYSGPIKGIKLPPDVSEPVVQILHHGQTRQYFYRRIVIESGKPFITQKLLKMYRG